MVLDSDETVSHKAKHQPGVDYAKNLDNDDPLRSFRDRFYLKKDQIYLCGNSLGLASKDAEKSVLAVMEKWKDYGVGMWNLDDNKYHLYSTHLAGLMAPLIGAEQDEVLITASTTVNIHQIISTLYEPTKKRYKILVDDINFPTDKYAVDSQVKLRGLDPKDAVKIVRSHDGKFMNEQDIINAMTDDVCLVLLPTVYYRSSQVLDMKEISQAAQERGILIGWDLSHAVGSIEINLKPLNVDFAVWCTYKYLNGGPGSTAGMYINRKHFKKVPGLAGWHGNRHDTQFLLLQHFEHEKSAIGWQIGTPSVLAMATLEGSLNIFLEAGMENLRKKSLLITGYLMYLVENYLFSYGFTIGNLKNDKYRGGYVSLEHDEAYRISLALRSRGVVPDFRDPNIIRVTPAALYISFEDVYNFINILIDIMKCETYQEFSKQRVMVV